jgi:hypothetical protein
VFEYPDRTFSPVVSPLIGAPELNPDRALSSLDPEVDREDDCPDRAGPVRTRTPPQESIAEFASAITSTLSAFETVTSPLEKMASDPVVRRVAPVAIEVDPEENEAVTPVEGTVTSFVIEIETDPSPKSPDTPVAVRLASPVGEADPSEAAIETPVAETEVESLSTTDPTENVA